jgi:hypothetical protein
MEASVTGAAGLVVFVVVVAVAGGLVVHPNSMSAIKTVVIEWRNNM